MEWQHWPIKPSIPLLHPIGRSSIGYMSMLHLIEVKTAMHIFSQWLIDKKFNAIWSLWMLFFRHYTFTMTRGVSAACIAVNLS